MSIIKFKRQHNLKKRQKPAQIIKSDIINGYNSKDSFTSSDFISDTDTDSNSHSNSESDFGLLINNASKTEQILSDNETDKLIINETTDKNLDNYNETDNKMLIINIHETSDNKLQTETSDNK